MKYQDFQVAHPDDYKKHHRGKLEHYKQLVGVAEHNVKANKQELEHLKVSLPSEQEFYELTDLYLLTLLNTTDLMEQDAVCNELVTNLRAGDNAVSVIKLNPPYDMMVDYSENTSWSG